MIRNKRQKKQLSFAQKYNAIIEVTEKGRHKKEVAVELEVHINSITNWMKIFREEGADGLRPPSPRVVLDDAKELQRLKSIEKKYNEKLVENEILKKFHAFLEESEKRKDTKPYPP